MCEKDKRTITMHDPLGLPYNKKHVNLILFLLNIISVQKSPDKKLLYKNRHQSGIALYNYTASNETLYLFAFV